MNSLYQKIRRGACFKTLGQAFQTLGRAFEALRENQKLERVLKKLGRVFVLQTVQAINLFEVF